MKEKLPRWKCHKEVNAAKILDVTRPPGDDQPYTLKLDGGISRHVDHAWCIKHCVWNPTPTGAPQNLPAVVGGYFVEYEDGYSSWSPAKAFEGGYTRLLHTVMVCGADCQPGDSVCNNYCNLAPQKGPMASKPPAGPDAPREGNE